MRTGASDGRFDLRARGAWLRIWCWFKVGVGFIKAWQIWVFWRVGLWIADYIFLMCGENKECGDLARGGRAERAGV